MLRMAILGFNTSLLLIFLGACDPERRNECEWYLEPDPSRIGKTDGDLIPVCARNFVSNKQDCRLQTTLDYAKKVHKMTFRYNELVVVDYGKPRTIKRN